AVAGPRPVPPGPAGEPRASCRAIRHGTVRAPSAPRLAGCQVHSGYIRIELDAVAGLVLKHEVPVLEERAVAQHQVLPPVDVPRKLVDPEVAHRCRGVAGGNGADRARRVVRSRPDVVVVREVVYPLRFQQTSRLRDVEVNGVAALELDQAAEAVARVQVLSRTNGDVDRVGDAGHRLWISRRDRILQPHRLYTLDPLRRLDRVPPAPLPPPPPAAPQPAPPPPA